MVKNRDAELHNPCLKEQEMSYKCLHDNGFDRDKCELYFLNYKNCKEFWVRLLCKCANMHAAMQCK